MTDMGGGVTMVTQLLNIDYDKLILTTTCEKAYYIEPYDSDICCSWTPTTEIRIYRVKNQLFCENLSSRQKIRLSKECH